MLYIWYHLKENYFIWGEKYFEDGWSLLGEMGRNGWLKAGALFLIEGWFAFVFGV
jgi:hypothetical protein